MERGRVAAIPMFADLPEGELDVLAEVAFDVDVASGAALVTEGELGHALFVIESGTANIVIHGATVRAIGPGDVVGEIAVLDTGLRIASVVATSPMRLIALFKRDVWALERRAPVAAQRLRAVLDEHRAATAPG